MAKRSEYDIIRAAWPHLVDQPADYLDGLMTGLLLAGVVPAVADPDAGKTWRVVGGELQFRTRPHEAAAEQTARGLAGALPHRRGQS